MVIILVPMPLLSERGGISARIVKPVRIGSGQPCQISGRIRCAIPIVAEFIDKRMSETKSPVSDCKQENALRRNLSRGPQAYDELDKAPSLSAGRTATTGYPDAWGRYEASVTAATTWRCSNKESQSTFPPMKIRDQWQMCCQMTVTSLPIRWLEN